MNNAEIIELNGHYYLKIDKNLAKRCEGKKVVVQIDGESLLITTTRDMIDEYWNQAAKDFKREIFMNTVRPLLKDQLGLNYSELKCEEKAKLLCFEYYKAAENGEQYKGPYLL